MVCQSEQLLVPNDLLYRRLLQWSSWTVFIVDVREESVKKKTKKKNGGHWFLTLLSTNIWLAPPPAASSVQFVDLGLLRWGWRGERWMKDWLNFSVFGSVFLSGALNTGKDQSTSVFQFYEFALFHIILRHLNVSFPSDLSFIWKCRADIDGRVQRKPTVLLLWDDPLTCSPPSSTLETLLWHLQWWGWSWSSGWYWSFFFFSRWTFGPDETDPG